MTERVLKCLRWKCDLCFDETEDIGSNIQSMRVLFREEGWRRTSNGTFCPTCLESNNPFFDKPYPLPEPGTRRTPPTTTPRPRISVPHLDINITEEIRHKMKTPCDIIRVLDEETDYHKYI